MSNDNSAKESKITGLLAEVAERIKNAAPDVYNRLRDNMVEKEVASRVQLLDTAFQKRRELLNELSKVNRPDQETFNADGSVATQSYTKARLEEIKKAKEVLGKMEEAIEKALAENDWSKLKNLVK